MSFYGKVLGNNIIAVIKIRHIFLSQCRIQTCIYTPLVDDFLPAAMWLLRAGSSAASSVEQGVSGLSCHTAQRAEGRRGAGPLWCCCRGGR